MRDKLSWQIKIPPTNKIIIYPIINILYLFTNFNYIFIFFEIQYINLLFSNFIFIIYIIPYNQFNLMFKEYLLILYGYNDSLLFINKYKKLNLI